MQTLMQHWANRCKAAAIFGIVFLGLLFLIEQEAFSADGSATKAISGGAKHSLVLKNDGTVWAAGYNLFGESGVASIGISSALTNGTLMDTSMSNVVSISAGGWDAPYSAHTLVLKNNGLVYAIGNNQSGQLGDTTLISRTAFVQVSNLYNVVAISAGGYHSLALKGDGTVWGWGANNLAQAGNPTPSKSQTLPLQVSGLTNIIAIAAGLDYSLALKSDGTVWGWGGDSQGQVGDGSSTKMWKSPVQVANLSGIIAIAAGGKHSIALKADGTIWCWGNNSEYECGVGFLNAPSPQKFPIQVRTSVGAVAIAAGGFHSMALTADGGVLVWGDTTFGQLGVTEKGSFPSPRTLAFGAIGIAAGEYHSLCIYADGRVAVCGLNDCGQSGAPTDGTKKTRSKPGLTAVTKFDNVALAVKNHRLEVTTDGSLWAGGYNGYGQLGDGTTANKAGNDNVTGQSGIMAASAGGGHSLSLDMNGFVAAWGNNNFGQLGDGNTDGRLRPLSPILSNAVAIASGAQHSLALKADGTVVGWGGNSFGQLGDGTFTNRLAPVSVTNLTSVSAIAAGGDYSLALLSNHTVVAWGRNTSGQVGDKSVTNRYGFTAVAGLANVTSIAAGAQHSLAISNGSVWSWGNNAYGQLGDGSNVNRSNPVQVVGLPPNIAVIAVGDNFSSALSSNGTVWVWGGNVCGQLGANVATNQNVPVQIANLVSPKAIEAGGNYLRIVMSDGSSQTLGANNFGQLENGTIVESTSLAISPQYDTNQLNSFWRAAYPSAAAAASDYSIFFIRGDRTLWSEFVSSLWWSGLSADGQVVVPQGVNTIKSIAANDGHYLATKPDGTLWSAGGGSYGELGLGDFAGRGQLTQITNLSSVMTAVAGDFYSMAILSNKTVEAWGVNDYGQLGIGSAVGKTNIPIPIPRLANIVSVACGYRHALALSADGNVWAWGANDSGELGIGNTISTNAPTPIPNLSNVTAIAAGEDFSMAVSNGTVYVWGQDGNGRLGLGSGSGNKNVPTRITGLTGITQVQTGSRQAFALDSNGFVWAWGLNRFDYTDGNALGFGGSDTVNTPTKIDGLSNVVYLVSGSPKRMIAAYLSRAGAPTIPGGPQTAAAICADGSVWRWGIPWGGPARVSDFWDINLTNGCEGTAPYPGAYARGSTNSADFASFVIPLDFQVGKQFDAVGGSLSNLFPFLTNIPPAYHYSYNTNADWGETNLALRFSYQNPIVAFGSRSGGSSLYVGRSYRFIAYGGIPNRYIDYPYLDNYLNAFKVEVYSRSNYALIGVQTLAVPGNYNYKSWNMFLTNGLQTSVDAYGLKTTVSTRGCPEFAYGVTNGGVLEISQMGDDVATNYIYVIKVKGLNSRGWVSLSTNGVPNWQPLYTLDFNPAPPKNIQFLTQVQYDGEPLPSFYNGKTPGELMTNSWPVTNAVPIANPLSSNYTDIGHSPELVEHPTLDNFVDQLKHDPLAIARFVQNEIELTDALDYLGSSNQLDTATLKLCGINRGALATFMERQGSPVEQCSLLIYLLRKAGVPAVYVLPPTNGVKMYDVRLSQLLRFQLHNAVDQMSLAVNTNSLISINYPWVAAYIDNKWVHLFPWLKDTEIVQGPNVYDYLPEAYNSPMKWCTAYIYNDPQIMALGDPNDIPERLFPRFVNAVLATNAVGLSYDDFGVRAVNRKKAYNTWSEFPKPTWVAGTNLTATSLSEVLTNADLLNWNPYIFPFTNIFNTVQIHVTTNGVGLFDTQVMRACDLHDRLLLLYSERTTSDPNSAIAEKLYLGAFLTGNTNISSFTNDPSLLNIEVQSNVLSRTVSNIVTTVVLNRFLPVDEGVKSITNTFNFQKGDLNAICLDYGRVSEQMLSPLATSVWNTEYKIKQNPSITNSLTADQYQGPLIYLMGMAYYQKIGEFVPDNARLHGRSPVGYIGIGAAKLVTRKDDSTDGVPSGKMKYVQPCVDMHVFEAHSVAAPTVRPDSPANVNLANDGFNIMAIVDGSAKEHNIINTYFAQDDAVSTVKLLQLAQSRHLSAPQLMAGIISINQNTVGWLDFPYTYFFKTSVGWRSATETFADIDSNIETNVLKAVLASPESQAFLTPGIVTNNTASYQGAGALIIDRSGEYKALISGSEGPLNGAFGEQFGDDFNIFSGSLIENQNGLTFYCIPVGADSTFLLTGSIDRYQLPIILTQNQNKNIVYSPIDQMALDVAKIQYNLSEMGNSAILSLTLSGGDVGTTGARQDQWGADTYDPVNSVTGEFYIDTVDLDLVGPLPLEIRRNYSSLNQADNQFGHGWKPSFIPYICIATNEAVLYVAEPNGSVLAYEPYGVNGGGRTNWQPTLLRNPGLVNNREEGVGSTANLFLTKIVQTNISSITNYFVYSPNGDVRDYQVMPFAISNVIDLTRPYLKTWADSRGNSLNFTYGTNSQQADYAELIRVDSSSGAYLQFTYDTMGHITEALSGDGRDVKYTYDEFGDLTRVVLPDASELNYIYGHDSQSITNKKVITQQPYSTHLLTQEIKPEGRILANVYDVKRRVTSQASTVGPDLTLVTNANFGYFNDFVLTNCFTNAISGYTTITDVFNGVSTYCYTNSRITNITDALNRTIQQIWYDDNTNQPGYYPRSVWKRIDQRGLTSEFRYDSFGNITNVITSGTNLTGLGGGETAARCTAYNTNNLPVVMVDPLGNSNVIRYDSTFLFSPREMVTYKQGVAIVTNEIFYGNSSNVVVFGNEQWTNLSFGLSTQRVAAYSSPDAATNQSFYNGGGFLTNEIDFTGTLDPTITNSFFYNGRNQLFARVDGAGRTCRYDYDGSGRRIAEEEFEAGQTTPMSWQYYYYSGNGDLTWYDGPQFDPEDYVWYDYDGAGRKTAEVHWRSRAKSDGSGVEAESDSNIYSITSYEYDAFGNLIKQTDPIGNYVVMSYDVVGQMIRQVSYDTNGAPLATNQMSYETGGSVANATNSLGGVTRILYTQTGKPYFRYNADGSTNAWQYDLTGRVTKESQPNGSYWQTTYDDLNRKVTRQFKDSSGGTLATTTSMFDRRGNLITNVTAEGAIFYSAYDQQNRLKVSGGPATINGVSTQQISYVDYDIAGVYVTNRDSLGLKKITQYDAIQRPISVQIWDTLNGNTVVSVQTTTYSSNHHAVTVTLGGDTGAVSSTTFYDSFNNPVLSQSYPSTVQTNFTISYYDAAGRLTQQQDELQRSTFFTYDGLGRVARKQLPDGAAVLSGYNSEGGLTSMTMPGGLVWSAAYNQANQRISEQLWNGTSFTRQFTNILYGPGLFAGLPQQTVDVGRHVTNTFTYDSFGRVSANAAAGGLDHPEQALVTTFQYDRQGLITNYTQTSGVNPTTSVIRYYDGYKQLTNEQVAILGISTNTVTERWTAAGRRAVLKTGLAEFDYTYRADGTLTNLTAFTNAYCYNYGSNGLLISRSNSWRTQNITQRDGRGRVTQENDKSFLGTQVFGEALSWLPDSTLSSYQATRTGTGFWNSTNVYQYNTRGQLTNELLGLSNGTNAAYTYGFDANKLGIRTSAQLSGGLTNGWQATSLTNLNEVFTEKWQQSAVTVRANGSAGSASSVATKLDGSSVGNTLSGGRWYSDLNLSPGSHTLMASAAYNTGQFTNTVTSAFNVANTNNVTNYYDGAGNVTNRIFANGRTQLLVWDAVGRLVAVVQRENATNGFNWTAIYDALGRRLRTSQTPIVNGVTNNVMTLTVDSYYDPQVEFGEIGVAVNGQRTWKVVGPDMNGMFGSFQGVGGLEATVTEINGVAGTPVAVLNDYFGNVVATISGLTAVWNPTRVSGYGPVEGYQASTLTPSTPLVETLVWRSRRMDPTGFYWIGARYYDPMAGRFISADPLGHAGSWDLYSFSNGDPLNRFDPDGRLSKSNTVFDRSSGYYITPTYPFGANFVTRMEYENGIGGLDGAVNNGYPDVSGGAEFGPYAVNMGPRRFWPASSTPGGAQGFEGSPVFIDTARADVRSQAEIVQSMRDSGMVSESQIQLYLRRQVVNNEGEVAVISAPPGAVRTPEMLVLDNVSKGLFIYGVVNSAGNLWTAYDESKETGNYQLLGNQAIRESGGWGGSILGGAAAGSFYGAVSGVETGPGVLVTTIVGGALGGYAGYKGADGLTGPPEPRLTMYNLGFTAAPSQFYQQYGAQIYQNNGFVPQGVYWQSGNTVIMGNYMFVKPVNTGSK